MNDGLLIEQVKAFPLLYDKSDKNFKNKLMRENAWKTIAIICEDTVEETERRWNVLRNRYASEKRKIKCIPSGSSSYTIWRFFEEMKFLDTHIVARRTKGNYNKENRCEDSSLGSPRSESLDMSSILTQSEDEQVTELFLIDSEEDLNCNTPDDPGEGTSRASTSTQRTPLSKKNPPSSSYGKKNKEEGLKRIVEGAMDNLKEMLQHSEKEEDDEDDLFAKSISMSLRQIKSKKLKARVKIRILQVIEEATEE